MSRHLDEAVLYGDLSDLDREHLKACGRCRTLATAVERDQALLLEAMRHYLDGDDFDRAFDAAETVADIPQLPVPESRPWLPVAVASGSAMLVGALWWGWPAPVPTPPVVPAPPHRVVVAAPVHPLPSPGSTKRASDPSSDSPAPGGVTGVVQCDPQEEMELEGPDCAVTELRCGDVVQGHTEGGGDVLGTRFYEKNFCTPALTTHDDAGERVYRLQLPEGEMRAFVTLETPCADLDVAALKLSGNTCPTDDSRITICEMYPLEGRKSERLELVSQRGSTWWVVVEGKHDEGAYQLSVECEDDLR